MIKNEEIRQIIIDILLEPQDEEDDCYLIDKKQMSNLLKYINQQQAQEKRLKKVEELVKLYKSVHGVVQSWDTMPDIQSQIDKLEKELGL